MTISLSNSTVAKNASLTTPLGSRMGQLVTAMLR